MNLRNFYEAHKNFSNRTIKEFDISPGIKCKFYKIRQNISLRDDLNLSIDIGCSGNSFLSIYNLKGKKVFLDVAFKSLKNYTKKHNFHPICASITHLPLRGDSFNFVSALDVLEHVKDEKTALSEISRIMKEKGTIVLSVPHRRKYFSNQDYLIGHYRRYEIQDLVVSFKGRGFKLTKCFGVYGQIMRLSFIQSLIPHKTENSLEKLRAMYSSNYSFKKIWDLIVKVGLILMKIDLKIHNLHKMIILLVSSLNIKKFNVLMSNLSFLHFFKEFLIFFDVFLIICFAYLF